MPVRYLAIFATLLAVALPAFAAPIEVPASGDAEICRVTREQGVYSLSLGRALGMRVTSDGACSAWLFRLPSGADADGPRSPFDHAVLVDAPSRGTVTFSSDAEKTFVTYTPVPGSVGEDRFAFRLLPGNGFYPVAVSVQPPGPPVQPPQPDSLYVYFDLDRSELTPSAREQLDRVASILADDKYRDFRLQISGHADARGALRHNQALSQRRTDAVLAYLAAKAKLSDDRVRASAFGDQVPLNGTDPRASENRRVHLSFVRGARALSAPVP